MRDGRIQQDRPPKLLEINLAPQLKSRLRAGHPWVYRDRLQSDLRLRSGIWVRLRCAGWTGYGLWDARSPIAVRVFSELGVPDARWVRERVRSAWERRAPLRQTETTAYRWLFGEGDGLPGLTVDLYGEYAVVQTYAESLETIVPWVVEALRETAPLRGILRRVQQEERAEDGAKAQLIWGQAPPADLTVLEHGLRFRANLFAGQKTGLFLDHRENRRFLEGWSAGRSVLNCFAYTRLLALRGARRGGRGDERRHRPGGSRGWARQRRAERPGPGAASLYRRRRL
jgi:23S rRNA (cytosine1962-C5)-methyltransferase